MRGVSLSPSNIAYTLSVQVTMHFRFDTDARRNRAIVECSVRSGALTATTRGTAGTLGTGMASSAGDA